MAGFGTLSVADCGTLAVGRLGRESWEGRRGKGVEGSRAGDLGTLRVGGPAFRADEDSEVPRAGDSGTPPAVRFGILRVRDLVAHCVAGFDFPPMEDSETPLGGGARVPDL